MGIQVLLLQEQVFQTHMHHLVKISDKRHHEGAVREQKRKNADQARPMDLRCCRHSLTLLLSLGSICPLLTVHPPLKGPPTVINLCVSASPRLQASPGQDCIFSFTCLVPISAWHVAEFRSGMCFYNLHMDISIRCPQKHLNSRYLT